MYRNNDISLVPFTEEHITAAYIGWLNDPEVCKHTSHCRWPMTKSRAIEYVNSVNGSGASTIVWAIKRHIDETNPPIHIGNVCLTQIDMLNKSAEFAIIIGEKESWGNSIATKVMEIVFGHGFLRLNLNRIWLGTAQSNVGMQKSAMKSGMRREGIFKNALFINGKFEDDYVYAINKYKYARIKGH